MAVARYNLGPRSANTSAATGAERARGAAGNRPTPDARHNFPRIGRVPIACGRDAVDCAMITSYGGALFQSMIVWSDQV